MIVCEVDGGSVVDVDLDRSADELTRNVFDDVDYP